MTDSWDIYFLNVCNAVSLNSKCLSRQIGAILVRDKAIICTGYNGPPRGIPHCEGEICPRRVKGYASGKGLHLCPAAHAERNTLITSARMGIRVEGCSIYMNCPIPCKDCLIEIINAGIKEIICTTMQQYDDLSLWLIDKSGIMIRIFKEPL